MSPFKGIAYEKLNHPIPKVSSDSDSDISESYKQISKARSVNIRSCPKILVLVLIPLVTLIAVLIIGGITLSRTWKPTLDQISISAHIPADYCGNTPAQAKAAGCEFELNNFAWVHPACFDKDLDDDWTSGPLANQLEFWERYGGKGPISVELAKTGEIQLVWVNTRQHRRHCLYSWEKYQRAAMDRRPMDNFTVQYKHTQHCIQILRDADNAFPDDQVSSYLKLKYPACEFGPVQINISPQ